MSANPTLFPNGVASALTGAELNNMLQGCPNVAALRQFIGAFYGQVIFLQGTNTANDGGQGLYTFTQGVASDNGVSVIVPTGVFPPAYWSLIPFNAAGTGGSTLTSQKLVATATLTSGNTGAISYGTLSYSDVNIVESLQGNVNSYFQVIVGNASSGASASSDFIVGNNLTTATTNYGDFGMNSSNFAGTGSLNLANAIYLYSNGGDLVIGTSTSNTIHFVTNNSAVDAMDISPSGVVSVNLGLQIPQLAAAPSSPGLGSIYWDTTLGYPRIWNGTSWNGFLLT